MRQRPSSAEEARAHLRLLLARTKRIFFMSARVPRVERVWEPGYGREGGDSSHLHLLILFFIPRFDLKNINSYETNLNEIPSNK